MMHRVNRLWSNILQELLLLNQNHQKLQGNHIQQKKLDIPYPLIDGPLLMESHLHIVRVHRHQKLLHFRGKILPKISKFGVCMPQLTLAEEFCVGICKPSSLQPSNPKQSHRKEKIPKSNQQRLLLLCISCIFRLFWDLKCIYSIV